LAAKDWPTAAVEFKRVLAWEPNDAESQKALHRLQPDSRQ